MLHIGPTFGGAGHVAELSAFRSQVRMETVPPIEGFSLRWAIELHQMLPSVCRNDVPEERAANSFASLRRIDPHQPELLALGASSLHDGESVRSGEEYVRRIAERSSNGFGRCVVVPEDGRQHVGGLIDMGLGLGRMVLRASDRYDGHKLPFGAGVQIGGREVD